MLSIKASKIRKRQVNVRTKLSYLENSYVSSYKPRKTFYQNIKYQLDYKAIKMI